MQHTSRLLAYPREPAFTASEKIQETKRKALHEKQHFRENAQRKYHIFLIFHNCRKYHIFCKTKTKENIIFSIIPDIFRNK